MSPLSLIILSAVFVPQLPDPVDLTVRATLELCAPALQGRAAIDAADPVLAALGAIDTGVVRQDSAQRMFELPSSRPTPIDVFVNSDQCDVTGADDAGVLAVLDQAAIAAGWTPTVSDYPAIADVQSRVWTSSDRTLELTAILMTGYPVMVTMTRVIGVSVENTDD